MASPAFDSPAPRAGTVRDVQRILGVGRSSVFELARAGHIRRVYLPGRKRPLFVLADAERLVTEGTASDSA